MVSLNSSPYGYPAKTHNLQKLSNIGYTYRNAFTVAPTCSPSRSALMTGLYPHQNGMFGLAHRGSKLNDYNLHLSNFLKSKNFETALFGIQHEISYENIAKLGYKHIEIFYSVYSYLFLSKHEYLFLKIQSSFF